LRGLMGNRAKSTGGIADRTMAGHRPYLMLRN
jgi:hypothetical protein